MNAPESPSRLLTTGFPWVVVKLHAPEAIVNPANALPLRSFINPSLIATPTVLFLGNGPAI